MSKDNYKVVELDPGIRPRNYEAFFQDWLNNLHINHPGYKLHSWSREKTTSKTVEHSWYVYIVVLLRA